ncbi:response regulator transcription factor [Dyella flagellata]|uniref:DNA-binding response regulator n=1 Tax=Dyella flagellata TaxID=1867833 RepID=A0ABQ5XAH4_9GAMM|nr:response regulator transcription factor [Dyella flagellata]GLQ88676.1 DNA-binding response regulator [Dyella flagellata]
MSTKFAQHKPWPGGCPIRVVIADDHPLTLAGLLHELQGRSGIRIVDSAMSSAALVKSLEKHAVDVIISDYAMPGGSQGDGIMLFELLRQRFPDVGLIALTMMSHADVIRSLLAQHVNCIISKADALEYLTTSVYAALAGKRYLSPGIEAIVQRHGLQGRSPSRRRHLSPRELEVVRLFVSGLTINEIAHHLQRSKQTVSTQKISAMRKLGISRDAELIKYGIGEQLTSQGIEVPQQPKRTPAPISEQS